MVHERSDLNELYSVPEPNCAMYIPAYRQFSEPDLIDFTLTVMNQTSRRTFT